MPKAPHNLREFAGLIKVVEALRGPDGCPWDKEQTHSTLTRYAIEEAHELGEAIDSGDTRAIRDELGDVLLQVVLHAEIARQAGTFDVFDVIQGLNEKMIRRHPHVFADVSVSGSGEVLKNWAEIKAAEKAAGKAVKHESPFEVPVGMPALARAHKIGEKTKKVGFDWENAAQCWLKVKEELGEVEELLDDSSVDAEVELEIEDPDAGSSRDERVSQPHSDVGVTPHERLEAEIGDLLFSVAQLARHLDIDPEQALRKTNTSFERRYSRMRELVTAAGRDWKGLSAEEKENFWKKAKS